MDYYTIIKWHEAAKWVQSCSVVAPLWVISDSPMFLQASQEVIPSERSTICISPGNYWWANGNYLQTLPTIAQHTNRHIAEVWLGLNNPQTHHTQDQTQYATTIDSDNLWEVWKNRLEIHTFTSDPIYIKEAQKLFRKKIFMAPKTKTVTGVTGIEPAISTVTGLRGLRSSTHLNGSSEN